MTLVRSLQISDSNSVKTIFMGGGGDGGCGLGVNVVVDVEYGVVVMVNGCKKLCMNVG